MNHILEVDSVIKHFNNKILLSDIYLKCETNDILALFGRNGSGKTTLLKIIFGTLNAENKFIKIDNSVLDSPFSFKNGISFLPQKNFIPKLLTVKKAISLFTEKNRVNIFYEDNQIELIKNKKIKHLSVGELKYLEIKLILSSKTFFSILDEPFSGLSPILIGKVKELILKESKNKGILIADHNYKTVLQFATKLYLLKNGKTILLNNQNQLKDLGYLTENSFIKL